jgi:hypothetical protein
MIDVHHNRPPTRPAMFVTITEDIGGGLLASATGHGPDALAAITSAYAKLTMQTAAPAPATEAAA